MSFFACVRSCDLQYGISLCEMWPIAVQYVVKRIVKRGLSNMPLLMKTMWAYKSLLRLRHCKTRLVKHAIVDENNVGV
jgi:hypothetical protein